MFVIKSEKKVIEDKMESPNQAPKHPLVFSESENGVHYNYEIKKYILEKQTAFQFLQVFETVGYGNMMVLDGCVMTTDKDEFVYHEMISHVPLCLHKNPEKVLIIGGGDGGTVREITRHQSVKAVTLCEIDGQVIEAAKQYFPSISSGFADPRVNIQVVDGMKFIADHPKEFDIIIIDSTDPVGPGEVLFSSQFYQSCLNALNPGGLIMSQTESPWYGEGILKKIQMNMHEAGFIKRRTCMASVPTYPRGLWSWTVGSSDESFEIETSFNKKRLESISESLKYLNSDVFMASFALPNFFKQKIFINNMESLKN